MDLRIFTEPQQGATYDDLLAVARATEELGFDGFFRSDHYLHMSGDGTPGPTDAWTTLAGLARDTSRIRLGTLVSSATFRLPGPLAVTVAGVDQMSGGRVELGLGAGWFEQEHAAYGIPFPSLGERFDRLEEQLAVITGLWSTPPGATFEHDGPHYPVRANPGLVEAGAARRRADHRRRWRASGAPPPSPPATPPSSTPASVRCRTPAGSSSRWMPCAREVGRDPATLVHSAAQVVCLGARRRHGAPPGRGDRARGRRAASRTASPERFEQARDRLGRLAEVGHHPGLPAGARPRRPRPPGRRARSPRRRTGLT